MARFQDLVNSEKSKLLDVSIGPDQKWIWAKIFISTAEILPNCEISYFDQVKSILILSIRRL